MMNATMDLTRQNGNLRGASTPNTHAMMVTVLGWAEDATKFQTAKMAQMKKAANWLF